MGHVEILCGPPAQKTSADPGAPGNVTSSQLSQLGSDEGVCRESPPVPAKMTSTPARGCPVSLRIVHFSAIRPTSADSLSRDLACIDMNPSRRCGMDQAKRAFFVIGHFSGRLRFRDLRDIRLDCRKHLRTVGVLAADEKVPLRKLHVVLVRSLAQAARMLYAVSQKIRLERMCCSGQMKRRHLRLYVMFALERISCPDAQGGL